LSDKITILYISAPRFIAFIYLLYSSDPEISPVSDFKVEGLYCVVQSSGP
jgi:hypothetical protein